MKRRTNVGYGKMIAERVLASTSVTSNAPRPGYWLDSWIDPQSVRNRSRRWLATWLKADLTAIPPDHVVRYLREMADDVSRLGTETAVDRFIDRILPPIVSNGAPDAGVMSE